MEKKGLNNNKIEYVEGLNYMNFMKHKDTIINSVKLVMTAANLTIYDLNKLTGIHHNTLKNIILLGKVGIFRTYSKLNNFVKDILTNDKKTLVLDDSFNDEIN